MAVITISRQFGAGGKTLGEMIAKKLNYSFVDNEIIQMVAKKAKVSTHWVESIEKEAGGKLLKFMTGLVSKSLVERILDEKRGYIDEEIFVDLLNKIITQIAEEGNAVIDNTPYDLIILDINLPGSSGLDWLRTLRQRRIDLPVLLLTARDTPSQRVEGLDAGADDYLVKPFDFEELLARIRALLRRRGTLHERVLQYRNISMDLSGKTVSKDGEVVSLSAKEFDILRLLMENIGRCLSKQQIEKKIYNWDDEFESNTVEVHISAIRRKLGKELIKTMRGIGYIMLRDA